jgi:hypothetical protein
VPFVATGGTTQDLFQGRIYRIRAANGFNLLTPIGSVVTIGGTASPMLAPTITPTGRNEMAVCLGSIAGSDTAVGSMTGAAGGSWTERANANSTTGGSGTINIQTSDQSGGQQISGGSVVFTVTAGSAHWTTVGFTLRPASLGSVEFNELAYTQATGTHDIRALYAAGLDHAQMVARVGEKAVVIADSAAQRTIDFRVTRAQLLDAFKAAVRARLQTLMKRRRVYVAAAAVDQIIAAGGSMTQTLAEVQASILDRIAE